MLHANRDAWADPGCQSCAPRALLAFEMPGSSSFAAAVLTCSMGVALAGCYQSHERAGPFVERGHACSLPMAAPARSVVVVYESAGPSYTLVERTADEARVVARLPDALWDTVELGPLGRWAIVTSGLPVEHVALVDLRDGEVHDLSGDFRAVDTSRCGAPEVRGATAHDRTVYFDSSFAADGSEYLASCTRVRVDDATGRVLSIVSRQTSSLDLDTRVVRRATAECDLLAYPPLSRCEPLLRRWPCGGEGASVVVWQTDSGDVVLSREGEAVLDDTLLPGHGHVVERVDELAWRTFDGGPGVPLVQTAPSTLTRAYVSPTGEQVLAYFVPRGEPDRHAWALIRPGEAPRLLPLSETCWVARQPWAPDGSVLAMVCPTPDRSGVNPVFVTREAEVLRSDAMLHYTTHVVWSEDAAEVWFLAPLRLPGGPNATLVSVPDGAARFTLPPYDDELGSVAAVAGR